MEKQTYEAISPIRFGGKNYPVGATVELTEEEARQYVDCLALASSAAAVVSALREECSSVNADLGKVLQDKEQLAGDLQRVTDERDTLTRENAELVSRITGLDAAIAERDQTAINLRGEIEALTSRTSGLETTLAERDQTTINLRGEIKALTAQIAELTKAQAGAGKEKKK